MAKNTGNLNAGTDSPALARQDLYDMATDMGYKETGNVSPISITGGNNKIVKTDASGNTRNIKTEDNVLINVSNTEALNVKNGSGDSVFAVNTQTKQVNFGGFGGIRGTTKMGAIGSSNASMSFTIAVSQYFTINLLAGVQPGNSNGGVFHNVILAGRASSDANYTKSVILDGSSKVTITKASNIFTITIDQTGISPDEIFSYIITGNGINSISDIS